jgi:mono/diheme cytochrome c family protein
MNREARYPSGVVNDQIATLEHIGLFAAAPSEPRLPALVVPMEVRADLAARARSYLHANCSNCHRPDGSYQAIDLRWDTPLSGMGLCNQLPEKGDAGVSGAMRLVPGEPGRSVLSLRMHLVGEGRMPQIGTSVTDQDGIAVVDEWIRSLSSCP